MGGGRGRFGGMNGGGGAWERQRGGGGGGKCRGRLGGGACAPPPSPKRATVAGGAIKGGGGGAPGPNARRDDPRTDRQSARRRMDAARHEQTPFEGWAGSGVPHGGTRETRAAGPMRCGTQSGGEGGSSATGGPGQPPFGTPTQTRSKWGPGGRGWGLVVRAGALGGGGESQAVAASLREGPAAAVRGGSAARATWRGGGSARAARVA